ncbi:DegV family protein [Nonomuraea ceibae]|uniref:DegV family protein n=1 Tax=Nonomuraea ceibae TaxID=1935170 RepID=UPI001FE2C386|nr:DegV family protein [Nonomuraea ceibae]
MPSEVAVVTDSTAYLPEVPGVTVVPVQVVLGEMACDEGDFSGNIAIATTSRPAPSRFAACYEALAAGGASAVVSIHLSAALSGTAESARTAARDAPVPVEVVDSRSIGMGLGYPVLAAARAAAAGGDAEAVATAARDCAVRTRTFFYVDSLDHIRRGGRIGAAASLLGSALLIKPLLHLVDGRISLLEKVRTPSRALGRLEDIAVHAAQAMGAAESAGAPGAFDPPGTGSISGTGTPGISSSGTSGPDPSRTCGTFGTPGIYGTSGPSTSGTSAIPGTPSTSSTSGGAGVLGAAAGGELVEIAVQHLAAPDRAEALADRLAKRLPGLPRPRVVEVGAVIGVHVGPGMLGVTITPAH